MCVCFFSIAHVRYIKKLRWLGGFRYKIANFPQLHCLTILRRDLRHKENQTKYRKITRQPWSHVRILIYRTWAIHTCPPNPPPHKQHWMCVSRIFSKFLQCVGQGERELQENFKKDALFFEGTQKLQKIMSFALLSQGLLSRIENVLIFIR